ncbi:MAG TPA: MBL fold metallo-hydrolase [Gaiella sp.]|jgi:glyoxylase-like metal-dependent hydrolase (beta-lactamase superfamily II)|nr:MBL fold metallo-hydrolase [Gaiella sp.]
MELRELRPGLWRWTAFHPEWREDVGSVAYDGADELVLVDPLLPSDDVLDELVARVGKPLAILVTVYWHTRSAEVLARRHHARVLAPSGGRAAVRRRAPSTEPFRPGDVLPGGVEAISTARANEVVYWIPVHRAVVPGDVLLGAKEGGIRMCPRGWLPEGRTLDELAGSLRPLLDLPVSRVLVSHGEPVLRNGRAALARALAR